MHILLLQCVYSYINLYFVRVFIVGLAAFFNVLSSSSTDQHEIYGFQINFAIHAWLHLKCDKYILSPCLQ